MENEIYARIVQRDLEKESGTKVVLTREVNRFVLWHSSWTMGNDELLVVAHWPLWDREGAVERSVDYARELAEAAQ